ncbi:hypothetical protein [Microvirga aerophila]|uniref:Uncharacterized protein n=1 Tax=Microvirga aerophila TaxID=670291 RepID=A0A512BRT4_9HYPH|nr:hypothetical protein [Microvirga aerophila]GEO14641.1 hypothetical protein MAE02_23370 [Microvirga aerophila]
MSSSRKAAANRANAQRSTGPRSAAGKTQSCRNARRHGLAIPASALPDLAPEILDLARRMAGPAADHPDMLQAAVRVVEAAVDGRRVRQARRELLHQISADPDFHELPSEEELMPARPIKVRYTQAMYVRAYLDGTHRQQQETEIAQIMAECAYDSEVKQIKQRRAERKQRARQRASQWEQLKRFARYERRALSRQRTAMKALDVLMEHISGTNGEGRLNLAE